MARQPARKPDFRLAVKRRDGEDVGATVGGGWIHDDGHISLKLNPGTVLRWNDDLYITLWPKDDK